MFSHTAQRTDQHRWRLRRQERRQPSTCSFFCILEVFPQSHSSTMVSLSWMKRSWEMAGSVERMEVVLIVEVKETTTEENSQLSWYVILQKNTHEVENPKVLLALSSTPRGLQIWPQSRFIIGIRVQSQEVSLRKGRSRVYGGGGQRVHNQRVGPTHLCFNNTSSLCIIGLLEKGRMWDPGCNA